MSDGTCIEVVLDKDRVKEMSSEEKLNVLVDLAFANYQEVSKQGKLLYGNGEEGLCDKVRFHRRMFAWLWTAIAAVGSSLGTLLLMHIFQAKG